MLILDNVNRKLQILLAAAGTVPWQSSWVEFTATVPFTPGSLTGVTAGTTPVDMVVAPAASAYRQVKWLIVRNDSGGVATVTIRYNDNGTARDVFKAVLAIDEIIQYTDGHGFACFTAAGELKVSK